MGLGPCRFYVPVKILTSHWNERGGGDFLSGKTLAAPNFVYTTAHSISCYLEENKGNVNLHVHLKFVINKVCDVFPSLFL